jgi:hypothetical protein
VQRHQLAAEQRYLTIATIVTGIAELETIDATQSQATLIIASRAQGSECNGVVEKQQILGSTGRANGSHASLTRLEAVEPQGTAGKHRQQAEYLHPGHQRLPRPRPATDMLPPEMAARRRRAPKPEHFITNVIAQALTKSREKGQGKRGTVLIQGCLDM